MKHVIYEPNRYHDLVKDNEAHNDQELGAYNYWDQLVIYLTDQDSDNPAEGFASSAAARHHSKATTGGQWWVLQCNGYCNCEIAVHRCNCNAICNGILLKTGI